MPPPQIFSLDGHAYGLTVSGVQVIDDVPVDLFPIRWDMPSEAANGGISFTVLDTGQTSLPVGSVVRLTDNVNNDLLASGVLVNRDFSRHGGPYRRVDCTVVGWGWYLDNRVVTSYVWPAGSLLDTDPKGSRIMSIVLAFGGPLLTTGGDPSMNGYYFEGGTAAKTSIRSAIGTLESDYDSTNNPFHIYVNGERGVRYWWGNTQDISLGTAVTSIGDEGDYIPEGLTYEVGSEQRANLIAAYGTAGDFLGWAWNGAWSTATAASSWEAGEPSMVYDVAIPVSNPLTVAEVEAWASHNDITSVTFTTTEYGGWQPHQALVIDDSMLTGGTAEVQYVAAVSGSIDYRNVIEWNVSTGAVGRSIVQTVATP